MHYVKPARLRSPLLLGTQGTRLEEAGAQEDNPDHAQPIRTGQTSISCTGIKVGVGGALEIPQTGLVKIQSKRHLQPSSQVDCFYFQPLCSSQVRMLLTCFLFGNANPNTHASKCYPNANTSCDRGHFRYINTLNAALGT